MLWGAIRKTMLFTARLCKQHDVEGCRQVSYNSQRIKIIAAAFKKSHRSRTAGAEEKKYTANPKSAE
jgi:hypothetical protein